MQILPNAVIPPKLASAGELAQRLNLKLEQVIATKVVETQIALQTITVRLDDKNLQLKTPPGFTAQPGDNLQLQVKQLQPAIAFRLLLSGGTSATELTLTATTITGKPALSSALLPPHDSPHITTANALTARIVEVSPRGVTLQLLTDPVARATTPNAQAQSAPALLTLDSRQLQWSPTPTLQTAPTPLPELRPGTLIELKPVDTSGQPTFNVTVKPDVTDRDIIDVLKTLLPIQDSPKQLLHQIGQALPQLAQAPNVAEMLKLLASNILKSLPQATDLADPQRLQTAIRDSGLFMESKLASILTGGTPMLHDDFKVKLNTLEQLLRVQLAQPDESTSTPQTLLKDLLHKTQAALANLTLDQLNSLPKDDGLRQVWTLELPFFRGAEADSVYLEIERDASGRNDDGSLRWAVNVTLTPPGLATIHCRISCYDGNINTRFWSESSDAVSRINAHLDYLKQQFEAQGLKAGFMEAHHGQPSPSQSPRKPPFNLLNEKA